MVSTRTQNRQRKVAILQETLNDVLALLLMEHKDRDRVNMAAFKELSRKIKGMLLEAQGAF